MTLPISGPVLSPRLFSVGQVLHSYCGGAFGRDFYGGRIEAVGWDWVVARSDNGYPCIAHFEGGLEAHAGDIARWSAERNDSEDDDS